MARCASIILLGVASAADVVGAFRAQPSSIHHRITESRPTASSLGLPRGIIAAKEGKEQRGRGDFALSFLRSDVDAAGELSAEVAIDIDAELAFIARRKCLVGRGGDCNDGNGIMAMGARGGGGGGGECFNDGREHHRVDCEHALGETICESANDVLDSHRTEIYVKCEASSIQR